MKNSIENEVQEFYQEINRVKNKEDLSTLQIEELITPMVYRNITQIPVGDFKDKIRGIIEKSCLVMKQSLSTDEG